MADKDSGEAVQAYIVLRDGDMAQERAVEALEIRGRSLVVHMRPEYTFVDSLPKTGTVKSSVTNLIPDLTACMLKPRLPIPVFRNARKVGMDTTPGWR